MEEGEVMDVKKLKEIISDLSDDLPVFIATKTRNTTTTLPCYGHKEMLENKRLTGGLDKTALLILHDEKSYNYSKETYTEF